MTYSTAVIAVFAGKTEKVLRQTIQEMVIEFYVSCVK